MSDAFKLYLRYIGISFQAQMQYKVSFLIQTIGHGLATGIEFLGVWALFARFGTLKGWSLPEIAVLYGIVNISFALADAIGRGFDKFGSMVQRGDFDRLLLRPRSTELQLLGVELTLKRIGRLSQGILVTAWGAYTLSLPVNFFTVTLIIGMICGGIALFMGMLIIQATITFWTVESLEIINILTYGGVETAQYPLSIYGKWVQRFFIFVFPLACVTYFPFIALTQKEDSLGSPFWFQCCAPVIGFLFLLFSIKVWRFGIKRYCSTGS